MYAGRQLPHRLRLRPRVVRPQALSVAAGVIAIAASGCASDRYVGAIGADHTYGNRGYGIAIRLGDSGSASTLEARWRTIDPRRIDDEPDPTRPTACDEPIDLDGNGVLEAKETTHLLRPMLRLVSKTSTGTAMSIDVNILGKNNAKVGLEALLLNELQQLTSTSSATEGSIVSTSSVALPMGNPVRIAEINTTYHGRPRAFRVALADQGDVTAEDGFVRRQIVRIVLATQKLTDELRRDHELLLGRLFLGRQTGELLRGDHW